MGRKVTIHSGMEMLLKESIADEKPVFDESDCIKHARMSAFDKPEGIDCTKRPNGSRIEPTIR